MENGVKGAHFSDKISAFSTNQKEIARARPHTNIVLASIDTCNSKFFSRQSIHYHRRLSEHTLRRAVEEKQ